MMYKYLSTLNNSLKHEHLDSNSVAHVYNFTLNNILILCVKLT
jgi:hypothetical protein